MDITTAPSPVTHIHDKDRVGGEFGISAKDAAQLAGSRQQADALLNSQQVGRESKALGDEIVRNLIAIKDNVIHTTDKVFETERRLMDHVAQTRELVRADGEKTRELVREQHTAALARENLDLREGQRLDKLQLSLLGALGKAPVV